MFITKVTFQYLTTALIPPNVPGVEIKRTASVYPSRKYKRGKKAPPTPRLTAEIPV